MSFYETTFIARQDLSKSDVTRLVDNFTAVLTEQGGSVVRTEHWGLRNLAYRVNKNKKGHYVMLAIDAPAAAVKEMERTMRINEEVIRMLTVRVEEHGEEMSAMMNQRSGREEGGEFSDAPAVDAPAPTQTDAA